MKLLSCIVNRGRVMGLALVLCSLGSADTTLFTRALPSGSDVNLPSGNVSRSNVDWANYTSGGDYLINGDSFTVTAGQEWSISSISIYIVLNEVGNLPSDEFSAFALYVAPDPGHETAQNFTAYTSLVGTPTLATYSGASGGCSGYLSLDGTCLPIYKLTFSTPGLVVTGTEDFAADGTLKSFGGNFTSCDGGTADCGFYNLAADGSLAGYSASTYTNLLLNWCLLSPSADCGSSSNSLTNLDGGYYTFDSSCSGPASDIPCGGFTSSSNMNVIVTGNSVPEPGTVTMFGLAGLAVAIAQIRRRRSRSSVWW